jgi:hypothetical protein
MKAEKERRNSALGSSLKTVRAKIMKSRFGTEFRNVPFLLDFSIGPAKYSGLFTLCDEFGLITKAGAMYHLEGVFEKSFYKKDFIGLVRENEKDIIQKIQQKLEEAEKRIFEKKKEIEVKDIAVDEAEDYDKDAMMKEFTRDMEKTV